MVLILALGAGRKFKMLADLTAGEGCYCSEKSLEFY
jgi:hypothetical protein